MDSKRYPHLTKILSYSSGPWGDRGEAEVTKEDLETSIQYMTEDFLTEEENRLRDLIDGILFAIDKYDYPGDQEQKNVPEWKRWVEQANESLKTVEEFRKSIERKY